MTEMKNRSSLVQRVVLASVLPHNRVRVQVLGGGRRWRGAPTIEGFQGDWRQVVVRRGGGDTASGTGGWWVGPKREGLEKRQRKKKSTAEAEHVRKMDDEGVTHLPYRTRTTQ
jgi:hypothetical protein